MIIFNYTFGWIVAYWSCFPSCICSKPQNPCWNPKQNNSCFYHIGRTSVGSCTQSRFRWNRQSIEHWWWYRPCTWFEEHPGRWDGGILLRSQGTYMVHTYVTCPKDFQWMIWTIKFDFELFSGIIWIIEKNFGYHKDNYWILPSFADKNSFRVWPSTWNPTMLVL